jgi:GxxExxY protein
MNVQRSPLAGTVIGSAMDVHSALGPGLFESAYDACLAWELGQGGIAFVRQVRVPLAYKGVSLDCSYRIDFIVEGSLLLELKAVERVMPIHEAQVLTYLRLLRLRQALLINFNVVRLADGLRSFLCDGYDGSPKRPVR